MRPDFACFPLFPVLKDGKCACGDAACKAVGKHPRCYWSKIGKGEQIPVPDGCGIGIATGERSGIFVLDLDSEDAVRWADGQGLPRTYAVQTGRDVGVQLYFRHPGFYVVSSAGKIFPKADIKGDGGFVCGEGTRHKSGRTYEVIDDSPIANAPTWLLEWPGLKGTSLEDRTPSADAPTPVTGEKREKHLARARGYIRTHLPEAMADGGRRWDMAVYLMRREELDVEDAHDLLTEPIDGGLSYADRFEDGWDEYNIRHKLLDARDHFRKESCATVDFAEKMQELAKPPALRERAKEVPDRQRPDPGHQYTHVPGHNAALSERKKVALTDAIQTLSTHPDWSGVLQYDEFRRRPVAVNPPLRMDLETIGFSDVDVTNIRTWFEASGVNVGHEDGKRAIEAACMRNRFHPVREYLDGLAKPTTRHLDNLAGTLFGNAEPLKSEYVRKWLVSAVARIMQPGCQADTVLTLCGERGGEKKSTAFKTLFKGWYRSDLPDISNARSIGMALRGNWCVELGELKQLQTAGAEAIKEFLTRASDKFDPKYAPGEIEVPRECVFGATTNDVAFLDLDEATRRRFWPIEIKGRIDTDRLAAIADEIWAEAVALYRAGERWWFEDEAVADAGRQEHILSSSLRDRLLAFLRERPGELDRKTSGEIFGRLMKPVGAPEPLATRGQQNEISRILKAEGYRQQPDKSRRAWLVPAPTMADPAVRARVASEAEPANPFRGLASATTH